MESTVWSSELKTKSISNLYRKMFHDEYHELRNWTVCSGYWTPFVFLSIHLFHLTFLLSFSCPSSRILPLVLFPSDSSFISIRLSSFLLLFLLFAFPFPTSSIFSHSLSSFIFSFFCLHMLISRSFASSSSSSSLSLLALSLSPFSSSSWFSPNLSSLSYPSIHPSRLKSLHLVSLSCMPLIIVLFSSPLPSLCHYRPAHCSTHEVASSRLCTVSLITFTRSINSCIFILQYFNVTHAT